MAKLHTLQRVLPDQRSGHVVFVSHCLLNQNVRYLGGACAPGMIDEVVADLRRRGAGVVQMPCPEQQAWGGVGKRLTLVAYGADRKRLTRIARRVGRRPFELYTRWRYHRLARRIAAQIADYRHCGYAVDGIIGVAGSPSCGVESTLDLRGALDGLARPDPLTLSTTEFNRDVIGANTRPGQGLFIAALRRQLSQHGLATPVIEFDPVQRPAHADE